MVEVFITSVETQETANELLRVLHHSFPDLKMNFDLEDCDRILRAEGSHIKPESIIELFGKYNHSCSILD